MDLPRCCRCVCVTKTTSKFQSLLLIQRAFCKRSIVAKRRLSHHEAVSAAGITVVTDKFSISSRSHLTKACYSPVTSPFFSFLFFFPQERCVFVQPSSWNNHIYIFYYCCYFFRKELPKSCNYHFHCCETKTKKRNKQKQKRKQLVLRLGFSLGAGWGGEVGVGVLFCLIFFFL